MQMIKTIIISLAILLIAPSIACATVILDDDFTNANFIDLNKTTAHVDTVNGWITLPHINKPNAIAMRQFGYEYAVATTNGVKVFTYDDATDTMMENSLFSIPTVTNALGVAVRQDEPSIWTLTDDELTLYKLSGTSMSPNNVVTGLTNAISVGSWSTADKAAVLTKSSTGTGVVSIYNASSSVPEISFDTGKTNPIAVSVVSGTPDLVVATDDAYYYYALDDTTGNYVLNPHRNVLGLSGIISVDGNDSGVATLTQSGVKYFFNNDAGEPQQATALGINLASGVAISLKPDSYDYAVVTNSGDVHYYMYADGGMKRVSALEVTGLSLTGGYLHPREYHSKAIPTSVNYDEARLTVDDDIPGQTSIRYFLSSDGGANWNEIEKEKWVPVPPGNQFVVKAILDTTDVNITPKIMRVELEVTTLNILDIKAIAIAFNDGSQALPTNVFPVKVKAGAEILIEVTTEGYAENLYAVFSTGAISVFNLHPIGSMVNDVNTWRGTYIVPGDAVQGSFIAVTFTAEKSMKQKHLTVNPFIYTDGQVSNVIDLKLTR